MQNGPATKFLSRKFLMIYNPTNKTWKYPFAYGREWIVGSQKANGGNR